jgi:hypothetical protein
VDYKPTPTAANKVLDSPVTAALDVVYSAGFQVSSTTSLSEVSGTLRGQKEFVMRPIRTLAAVAVVCACYLIGSAEVIDGGPATSAAPLPDETLVYQQLAGMPSSPN